MHTHDVYSGPVDDLLVEVCQQNIHNVMGGLQRLLWNDEN